MSEPATLYNHLDNTTAAERSNRTLASVARPAGSVAEVPALPPALPAVAPSDWTHWYLTDEDDVGQSLEHLLIVDMLLHLCQELAKERGWESVLVGSDQFIAWNPDHKLARVSPDVYITDNPPVARPSSWETLLPGQQAPRFAVEVVSGDWRKDYTENPRKYASLGVRELVLVDPYAFSHPKKARSNAKVTRVPLQVYRIGADGRPERVAAGPGPVHCAEIDAYLLFCRDRRGESWVRISRDAAGRDWVPTADERADAQAARADAQAARADAQAARAAATAAERDEVAAELGAAKAELGAALERLREHGLI